MILIIIVFMTFLTIILLITDIVAASSILTTFLIIFACLSFFSWIFFAYSQVTRKRLFLFSKAMLELNRQNPKYETLFTIYDFIREEENNLEVVKDAMKQVYFFNDRVIKNPTKVKKKQLYNCLIEYYLSLSTRRLKVTFFWDYNKNYFTWKLIGITSFIGLSGIFGAILAHHYVASPNEILYFSLYFLFGIFMIPLIAKLFDHFI